MTSHTKLTPEQVAKLKALPGWDEWNAMIDQERDYWAHPHTYRRVVMCQGEVVDHCGHQHQSIREAERCSDAPKHHTGNTGPAFTHVLVDETNLDAYYPLEYLHGDEIEQALRGRFRIAEGKL